MKTPADEQLVKKALAGDNAAFGLLVLRHQRDIYKLALHYLRNSADAEDLSQEAFIEAYTNLRNLQEPAKFAPWLRGITRHLCISWLRRQPKSVSYEEVMHDGMFEVQIIETSVYRRIPAPDDALEQKELRESILAAINSLSEKNRLAISLHYLDGMSYKEIADFLKVSISTIEGRLYRARKQLKEEMIKMTKEVIDTSRIEAELQEMRNQITDLRRQFEIFRQEESGVFNAERKAAFDIICRLPSDAENPITWGFAGAYRYGNRGKKGRVSFWSSSIDEYINAVTDSEVSDFASMFTNRIAINVLKQLIEGQKSVAELAKVCGITDGKMNQTLEPLIAANLVHRKEGDVIKAEYDALAYILTLVNITRLYAEHLKSEK